MSLPYTLTLNVLPLVLTAAIQLIIVAYTWRHRAVAGAAPFALCGSFLTLTTLANALEIAAIDLPLKFFWRQVWFTSWLPQAPLSIAIAVEYAGIRTISRRSWVLLSLIPFIALPLMLTNDAHHLIWTQISFGEQLDVSRGFWNWLFIVYGYLLRVVNFVIFGWVFLRSHGLYRWQAAILGFAGTTIWLGLGLRFLGINLNIAVEESIAGTLVSTILFAWGLFYFRTFDLVPVARATVIAQMQEGMLVLDNRRRVVDLNRAAGQLIGISSERVVGSGIEQLLNSPSWAELARAAATPTEQRMQLEVAQRSYQVHLSPLTDGRGFRVGSLIMLHDITELARAQHDLLQDQRALAALQERDRVARELHDSLGQVLGYVKMQAHAARGWLAQERIKETDDALAQLIVVAQEAHADVREYILGAKLTPGTEMGLLPALKQYLEHFSEQYKMRTELIAPSEPVDGLLDPTVEAQVLRIIQEALTNARKHARAASVQVSIQPQDSCAQIVIQDDGAGFDPARLATEAGQRFGLRFMRERAEDVGGSVQVVSSVGHGTSVIVTVPVRA